MAVLRWYDGSVASQHEGLRAFLRVLFTLQAVVLAVRLIGHYDLSYYSHMRDFTSSIQHRPGSMRYANELFRTYAF